MSQIVLLAETEMKRIRGNKHFNYVKPKIEIIEMEAEATVMMAGSDMDDLPSNPGVAPKKSRGLFDNSDEIHFNNRGNR